MEKKTYELFPVGKLLKGETFTVVQIKPDFCPALKYLELFSHAIVFLEWKKERNREFRELFNIPKEGFRITDMLSTGGLSAEVVRILGVDDKKGVIEIDYAAAPAGTTVYDVKPYFPCEDRVKELTVPDSMMKWGDWRVDQVKAAALTGFEQELSVDLKRDEPYCLPSSGLIRKMDGECLIELTETNEEFFSQIKDFSHVRILWWFDRFDKSNYRKVTRCDPPYENAPRTGVFASRSPVRPNPIAMTTARILNVDIQSRKIRVSGLDAFDKTPVIDIIPYIPVLDRVRECNVPEWLNHWPEWLNDRETQTGFEGINRKEADADRIQKYVSKEYSVFETVKSIDKEEIQSSENVSNEIVVKGARQNNLKNINFSIPKHKMTVVTGVSGSGKSSLAFDTIFAESQRRFMDSMSASGRMSFDQMVKPDVDQITGLPPAVAIDQKSAGRNPRSTVGTMTDIYDYLRLLFSKIGTRHCPECGRAITPFKADEITGILVKLVKGTVFSIRAFNREDALEEFVAPGLNGTEQDIYHAKLKECIHIGLSLGNGAILVTVNRTDEFLFQTREMCYPCNRPFFELSTSTFSFNNPESMCPVCKGLGVKLLVDAGLIVSNPDISILDGASKWWGDLRKFRQRPNANWMKGEILALAEEMGVDLELPWKDLPETFKQQAIYGSGGREVSFYYENSNGRRGEIVRKVEGAFHAISRLFKESSGDTASRISAEFMREKVCNSCHGERLAAEGRMVFVAKTRFPETVLMTIEELKKWVKDLPAKLTREQLEISGPILNGLNKKLENLIEVGVPYLTLNRTVPTLSGGELQRLRLAAQLGSGITDILYVLDEPSAGLHPKDQSRLIKILQRIRDEGNTILVVEHDADTMLAADKIIDVGPGAGIHGGRIIAEGTPKEIMLQHNSETGKFLSEISAAKPNNKNSFHVNFRTKPYGWIKVKGAGCNNLKHIDAAFPLGVLTCVTGVSGSGKSSLVLKTLYPALAKFLNKDEDAHGDYEKVEGLENADNIIRITQHPIGRTPRSNPATYTGVFDHIRNLFTSTEAAKKRGYKQNRFSFNSKEGQCEVCRGEGRKCVEMHFMPDVWIECPVCRGKRFNAQTLEIKYNNKSIADILNMNMEEALYFFKGDEKITGILQTLYDVGLGYIKLGQSALTLSGGEAQRIKLAKELSKTDTGKTIYLLDEPTTGLHFSDIQNLLKLLHRIKAAGNTVIIIEHNLEVIKNADWIIDMGPEGGNAGGFIIAQGTPEEVALRKDSYTGRMLRKFI